MMTLKEIASAARCDTRFVLNCIERGDAPECTTTVTRKGRLMRQWDAQDAEATIAAVRARKHRTVLSPEEELEVVEQCKGLRESGLTWAAINALLDTPYSQVDTLRLMCLRHGYKDTRINNNKVDREAKREHVSMAWANNPPPGSEQWSDEEWLRRIDQAAFGKRVQEEDTND